MTRDTRRHLLQSLALPDPEMCTERELYVRLNGGAWFCGESRTIGFAAGDRLAFDTYFNLFPLGQWVQDCGLEHIELLLSGAGEAEIRVVLAHPERPVVTLAKDVIRLDKAQPLAIPLPGQTVDQAVLYLELVALGDGHLHSADWTTRQPPRRRPDIVLAVTTYRREQAILHTVARFEAFASVSPLAERFRMLVIDNGRSADIPPSERVTCLPNENLGGAGGFCRGLSEARARGATHCIFMDDDARTPMDALDRTWRFLAYAKDDAAAVAGAMIATRQAWTIWENGAVFDGFCRPVAGGTDLRDPGQVIGMISDAVQRKPFNFYGGWWFFAFPLAHVRHLPFPFFVRGDDVSFSLAHDFDTATLPGVVSFQESFTEKDTPLTWYLDLRSHLAHLLSLPCMDVSRAPTLRVAVWFWARTLLTCHYETMQAINLALEDVLAGPDYFAAHPDAGERRSQLNALRQVEAWHPCAGPPAERRRFDPDRRATRILMRFTLNGLLVPFFSRIGNRITLPPGKRWAIRAHWAAAQITYYDPDTDRAYTVRHDKRRAVSASLRTARLIVQLWARYNALKTAYQAAYPDLTSAEFWAGALGLEAMPDAASVPSDDERHGKTHRPGKTVRRAAAE
ncbi:MAG: glycosyl transferase [Pseudomonadota bacterium]